MYKSFVLKILKIFIHLKCVSDIIPLGVIYAETVFLALVLRNNILSGFLVTWQSEVPQVERTFHLVQCVGARGLQEQRCVFSGRLPLHGELPRSGQEAAGQRGEVVTRVQDVGLAALAFLQPHEVRAGREERAGALAVELQDDAANAEHHPHCDHDVV